MPSPLIALNVTILLAQDFKAASAGELQITIKGEWWWVYTLLLP